MRGYTTVEVEGIVKTVMEFDLDSVSERARRMLKVALQVEVDEYIQQHQEELDEHGKRKVVRIGSHPERELMAPTQGYKLITHVVEGVQFIDGQMKTTA